MPAWHTHTLVGMCATHGGHRDSPCPVGVWLPFMVSYTAVSSHTHGHTALRDSYILLGAYGPSPRTGEDKSIPAWLGPGAR